MLNILPLFDIKEHNEDSTCECEPEILFINDEMIVIHNSFDGREAIENAYEILKEYDNES